MKHLESAQQQQVWLQKILIVTLLALKKMQGILRLRNKGLVSNW
jgi:hypothetical protein